MAVGEDTIMTRLVGRYLLVTKVIAILCLVCIYMATGKNILTSINGLVVEFIVAIDEARVRFTVDAKQFLFRIFFFWR